MGKHLCSVSGRSLGIIFVLVFCTFTFSSHDLADAESKATIGVVGASDASRSEDSWIAAEFKGQIDRPLSIHLNLSPYPPPAGTFYTALVEVLESPQGAKPEIVPGVPEISVRCPKPGIYLLRVRANLIEKSSCALANVRILKEKEIRLIITP